MITNKKNNLKKYLLKLEEEHETNEDQLRKRKRKNNEKVVNFIATHMDKEIFQKVFIYDLYKNSQNTVDIYYSQRNALLNVYDVNETIMEDFQLDKEYDYDVVKTKDMREKIIVYKSWIEHLEYVESIQKYNEKSKILTLINLRIKEKKETWSSGDHQLWLVSGTRALEWARSVI